MIEIIKITKKSLNCLVLAFKMCYNGGKGDGVEIRKPLDLRRAVVFGYFGLLLVYLLCGLTPARATEYEMATELKISSIGLESGVVLVDVDNGKMATPDNVVGSYSRASNKTFLVGHASGVFRDLERVKIGDVVNYDLVNYVVQKVEVVAKSAINMDLLLLPENKDTVVIMTCAGERIGEGDATHRLIITASVQ